MLWEINIGSSKTDVHNQTRKPDNRGIGASSWLWNSLCFLVARFAVSMCSPPEFAHSPRSGKKKNFYFFKFIWNLEKVPKDRYLKPYIATFSWCMSDLIDDRGNFPTPLNSPPHPPRWSSWCWSCVPSQWDMLPGVLTGIWKRVVCKIYYCNTRTSMTALRNTWSRWTALADGSNKWKLGWT